MNDYQATLASFANYFGAVAQVSGALVGLVFVALTFNSSLLGDNGHPGLRALARQVFADFLIVLVIALIMLIPGIPPGQLGFSLLITASVGIGRILVSVAHLLRDAQRSGERVMLLQRFGLSLLGNAFILIAGILAVRGSWQDSAYWSFLVMSPLVLIIAGSRSAWLLVTHTARKE